MLLKNRSVLITGSSRGIGAASAKLLAEHGASVAVNYHQNLEAGEKVVNSINKSGGRAVLVQGDSSNPDDVKVMVEKARSALGFIDTLVLNAGMKFKIAPFMEQQWLDVESKILGEMKSFFYPCQAILPEMIKNKKGSIITVSSGLSKRPGPGFITHSAAKAALNMMTNSLAAEVAQYGIRVNTVSPGLTLTDATSNMPEAQKSMVAAMNPTRRLGKAEDVAGAILLLASDYAGYINSGFLTVDGGNTVI